MKERKSWQQKTQFKKRMKTFKYLLAIIPAFIFGGAISAQTTLEKVLENVERNNLTLEAQRHGTEAKTLEARMGNSLEELSVSYDHLWGKPVDEFGKTGEFNVSQSFDFPTVYSNRSKVAGNLARQYGNEFVALRQQILLEAKQAYIELLYASRVQEMLEYRVKSCKKLAGLYTERFESGDASLLEKTKMNHEYLIAEEEAAANRMTIVELQRKLISLNGGLDIGFDSVADMPMEELPPVGSAQEDYRNLYPALQAYRLQSEGAKYNLKLSRSMALPKFEVGYKYEYATAGERFNGVTMGLSIPIFTNKYNVKRAKAAQQSIELEAKAAEVDCDLMVEEMYRKASLLRSALTAYDEVEHGNSYVELLGVALEAGQLSVVEYFSEIYSYYDVVNSKLRLELQYKLLAAEINSIYL